MRKPCSRGLKKWLSELKEVGLRPTVEILETCAVEDWELRERHHIAMMRAAGVDLLNLLDGGDGWNIDDRWKDRHRRGLADPACRKAIKAAAQRRAIDPVYKARHAEAMKKREFGEWRKNHAEKMRIRSTDPEWLAATTRGAKKRAKPVLQLDKVTGEVIARFESQADAANAFGITQPCISEVIHGKQKLAAGFKWAFAA